MRKLLGGTAALLALSLAGAAVAEDSPFAPDAPFDEAKALAASSGKPILVDFYTTW